MSRWEPVEDGMEPIEIEISQWIEVAGDDATSYHAAWLAYDSITIDRDCISWGAHNDIRLCRLVDEPNAMPEEVAATIEAALHFLRAADRTEMYGNQLDRIDAALSWLEAQTGQ